MSPSDQPGSMLPVPFVDASAPVLRESGRQIVPIPLPVQHLPQCVEANTAAAGQATDEPELLFIPGSGTLAPRPIAPYRRRWRVQMLVMAGTALVVGMILLTVGSLNAAALAKENPFIALASAIQITRPPAYVLYRIQPGDTFETIATRFGVQVNGIFALNRFYAGTEAQSGQMIRVSTDPAYGTGYVPQAQQYSVPVTGGTASAGGGCLFCVSAGPTNGAGHVCAAEGLQQQVDIGRFELAAPLPGAHWVRGFSSWHNGVDISTGVAGAPVEAVQAGQVIFAGWDPFGFGWSVKINHCGGLASSYGHLEHTLVHVGDQVTPGELVGLQGSSGMASGTHLHFMLWWNNAPIDPLCGFSSLAGISRASHNGCPAPQWAAAP